MAVELWNLEIELSHGNIQLPAYETMETFWLEMSPLHFCHHSQSAEVKQRFTKDKEKMIQGL